MLRLLTFTILIASLSCGVLAQIVLKEVSGDFGSSELRYCVRIPAGLVAKHSPGDHAFNLMLGEPGFGLIFFQANPHGDHRLKVDELMNGRIGTRLRDQSEGNGDGRPTAVSLFPLNFQNLKGGPVEGVRYSYYDKRWKTRREETVVLHMPRLGTHDYWFEFVLFSTPEKLTEHRKVFDAVLRSFRDEPC